MSYKLLADSSKIGVVFSSGFFGFFAHAGFLSALRELKINPVGYAGSSSGAIVAAMAASGMSDDAIRELLLSVKKTDFWDPDEWHVILKKALGLFRGYTGDNIYPWEFDKGHPGIRRRSNTIQADRNQWGAVCGWWNRQ